jgi:hypothetical protein
MKNSNRGIEVIGIAIEEFNKAGMKDAIARIAKAMQGVF